MISSTRLSKDRTNSIELIHVGYVFPVSVDSEINAVIARVPTKSIQPSAREAVILGLGSAPGVGSSLIIINFTLPKGNKIHNILITTVKKITWSSCTILSPKYMRRDVKVGIWNTKMNAHGFKQFKAPF